jgi:hypothetical protein
MEMSPFLKDVYNDYFQMLQIFCAKIVALYYESMPRFYFFSKFVIYFILFFFNLSQLKIHFNRRKWHGNPKNIFSLGMALLGSTEHVAQR